MLKLTAAFAVLALLSSPVYAAKPCRDAHGKFMKCATAAPKKVVRCKDSKGKFAKCGAPGTHPA